MATAILTIQIVMIVFFSIAGILKLIGHPHMKEEFDNFCYPYWLMRLAAFMELIAVSALIAGIWLPHFAALGGIILTPVMIGATYTNFAKRPAALGWGTLLLLGGCLMPAIYFLKDLITFFSS